MFIQNKRVYLYSDNSNEVVILKLKIMTRLQTLENRLARIQDKKDDYLASERIGGKTYRNPKASRYAMTASLIKKEIRTLEN